MEFIEASNACLGHYFGADKHFMVMMMIVTVRLIWLGTIVTWPSCRPFVLFLNKITMGILAGHGNSHGHIKSLSSVFTRRHKLQLVRFGPSKENTKEMHCCYFCCESSKLLLFQDIFGAQIR